MFLRNSLFAVFALVAHVNADFTIFQLGSPLIPTTATVRCRAALTANIACDQSLQQMVKPYDLNLTSQALDTICTPSCGTSIKSYASNVHTQCGDNMTLSDGSANFVDYGDQNSWRYDVACLKSSGGSYCQLDTTACSDCHLKTLQAELNSKFGQGVMGSIDTFNKLKANCSIATTLYPITFTASPAPTAPPVVASNCTYGSYTVSGKDSCLSISQAHHISTQALIVQNGLDYGCNYLKAGQQLCLPQTCATYVVQANDTCSSIMKAGAGTTGIFTQAQLMAWNTYIDDRCDNLADFVGQNVCISPPGETSAPNWADEEGVAVPKPGNANSGSNEKCAAWHTVVTGETCDNLTAIANTPISDLLFLNQGLREDCSNLAANTAYCVQSVGPVRLYDDYQPIVLPTNILTQTINWNLAPNNATKSYLWPNATAPPTFTAYNPPPTVISSIAAYTGCPDFSTQYPDFDDGEVPLWAQTNTAFMSLYSTYCILGINQLLPTGTPTWPTLTAPLTPVAAPTQTREGTVDDCIQWIICAGATSTCSDILAACNINITEFITLNPYINDQCSNLWPNYAYCVDDIARHPVPSRTPPAVTATGTGTNTATNTQTGSTTTSGTTSATATVAAPGPTASGTATHCTRWHVYKSGETCPRVLVQEGIKLPAFKVLNPSVDATCSNLVLGNAYCVAGSP